MTNKITQQLDINTDMDVQGSGIVNDTVVVLGSDRLDTWTLPAGDSAPDESKTAS